MKLIYDLVGFKNKRKVNLTKKLDQLIFELKCSLRDDWKFRYNYYYERPNGEKVFLCKMDRQYRINALNYFKRIQRENLEFAQYSDDEWDYIWNDCWLG
jgi:hypothetical protein